MRYFLSGRLGEESVFLGCRVCSSLIITHRKLGFVEVGGSGTLLPGGEGF